MCLSVSGQLCLPALLDGHLETPTLENLLGKGRARIINLMSVLCAMQAALKCWKHIGTARKGWNWIFTLFFHQKDQEEVRRNSAHRKGGAPSHVRLVLVGQPQCLDQLWGHLRGLQQTIKNFTQETCTEATSVLGKPCAERSWKMEKYQ